MNRDRSSQSRPRAAQIAPRMLEVASRTANVRQREFIQAIAVVAESGKRIARDYSVYWAGDDLIVRCANIQQLDWLDNLARQIEVGTGEPSGKTLEWALYISR